MRGWGLAIGVVLVSSCFDEPNYEGKACAASQPCPPGWICSAEGFCRLIDGDRDAAVVVMDAMAADVFVADATFVPDAAEVPDAMMFVPDAAVDAGVRDASVVELVVPVSTVLDDAMEGPPNGDTLSEYAWVSLYSNEHFGGVRLRLVDVDADDLIHSARLELFLDSAEEDSPDVDIQVQAGIGPGAFGVGPNDIALRPRLAPLVYWNAADLGAGRHSTPELKVLVDAVIAQPGWTVSSPLVFIFDQRDGMGLFEFRQFDHPPLGMYAPQLRVIYSPR